MDTNQLEEIDLNKVMVIEDNQRHRRVLSAFLNKHFHNIQIIAVNPKEQKLPGRKYHWQDYDLIFISLHYQRDIMKKWYQHLIGVRPPAIFIDDFSDNNEALEVTSYGAVDYLAKHKMNPKRMMAAILSTLGDRLLEAVTEEYPAMTLDDILDAKKSLNNEDVARQSAPSHRETDRLETTGVIHTPDLPAYIQKHTNEELREGPIDLDSEELQEQALEMEKTGQISIINVDDLEENLPIEKQAQSYNDATIVADHVKAIPEEQISDDDATIVANQFIEETDPAAEKTSLLDSIIDNDATVVAAHVADPPPSTEIDDDATIVADHIHHDISDDATVVADQIHMEREHKAFDFETSIGTTAYNENDIEQFWPFTMDDIAEGKARINYYQVIDLIGVGGMSAVFKVMRERDGDISAMKIINTSMLEDQTIKERFIREFKIGKTIENKHLIKIYAQGFEGDIAYIVMEHLDGLSLKDKIKRRMLSPKLTLRYLKNVAAAVGELHAHNIIHRDLKPSNIMFRGDGTLVVADFGISKALNQPSESALTREGEMVGTPYYVSPEQALGHQVDERSDYYALGLILYEMIQGKHPYSGRKALEVMYAHVRDPVPLFHGQWEEYNNILAHLLAKNPDDRYKDTDELFRDIDKVANALK